MKIPIVKYSDKFLDRISLLMKIGGITLFPYIILRERYRDDPNMSKTNIRVINHESIHIKQQQELLVIVFYVLYILEWFLKLFIYGTRAYSNISFEREAHANDENPKYLENRKFWAWTKYL